MTKVGTAALALCVGFFVIGCGGSSANGEADKSAGQILADAVSCLRNATSLHAKGSGTRSGVSLEFDIDITRTDTGWGTVDVNGERFQFVAVDGQFYINADAPFWTALGASAAESPLLANKWVTAPSQLAPQIQAAVAFSKVAGDLSNAPAGLSKAGRAAAPDGRQGIKLSAGEDVIYVSMTAPVCPIYVHAGVDSGGPSDLAFSNFNAPVVVTPPPNPVDGAGLFGA